MNNFNYVQCEICKRPATDRHHVYGGRLRQTSERYGMIMHLCRLCHQRLHRDPTGEWLAWKMVYQHEFDQKYGQGEFIKIFGRNYL